MTDYLDIFYNKENKPYTSYPNKLVAYLFDRLDMQPGMSMMEPGVGRGEHLREFKNLGLKVKGLDILELFVCWVTAASYYYSFSRRRI